MKCIQITVSSHRLSLLKTIARLRVDQQALDQIALVVIGVAGRERQDPAVPGQLYVLVDEAAHGPLRQDILQEAVVDVRVPEAVIVEQQVVVIGIVGGKDPVMQDSVGQVDLHLPVFVEEGPVLVEVEVLEHGSIGHIVSVEDCHRV